MSDLFINGGYFEVMFDYDGTKYRPLTYYKEVAVCIVCPVLIRNDTDLI